MTVKMFPFRFLEHRRVYPTALNRLKNQTVVIYSTALLSFSFSCSGTQAQPILTVPSRLIYSVVDMQYNRFHGEITFAGV